MNTVAQETNTVFKDSQIRDLQFGGRGISLALWRWLELLLLWHHETCNMLRSHFQMQEGESLANLMLTDVEELSSFPKRDLFQMEGKKSSYL